MTARDEALARIVTIAQAEHISAADIALALKEARPEKSSTAMRLFGYLGGIFIFSGIAAYIGMFWHDMNSAERVIITLGSGFVLFITGVLSARNRSRAAPPLLLLAALLQPGGLFIAIDEYFHHGSDAHYAAMFVFGTMLLQQALAFKSLQQAILLCSTIGFAALFVGDILDFLHVSEQWIALGIGLSLLLVTYGLERTPYRPIAGFWYFIGSVSFLWGAFDILKHTPVELAYLGLTCFMVYVSVIAQSTTLLVTSVLAMLGYIGYFTDEHFLNSVGWPISLIVLGLAFFGVSAGAIRIKKRYL